MCLDPSRAFGDLLQDPVPADPQPRQAGRTVGERPGRAGITGLSAITSGPSACPGPSARAAAAHDRIGPRRALAGHAWPILESPDEPSLPNTCRNPVTGSLRPASLQASGLLDLSSVVVYKTAARPVRAPCTPRQLWSSGSAGLRAVVLRLTRATHSRRGIVWRMRGDLQRSERPQVRLHVTAVCKTVGS